MPLSEPAHRQRECHRSDPSQQHRNYHRPREIGEGHRAENQHRHSHQPSGSQLPAVPIHVAFHHRPSWGGKLGYSYHQQMSAIAEAQCLVTNLIPQPKGWNTLSSVVSPVATHLGVASLRQPPRESLAKPPLLATCQQATQDYPEAEGDTRGLVRMVANRL